MAIGSLVLAILSVGLTASLLLPFLPAVVILAIALWFAVPGVIFAGMIYRRQAGRWIAAVLMGGVGGYALSSVVLLAMWTAGVRGVPLLAAPAGAIGIAFIAATVCGEILVPPPLDVRDIAAAGVLVALVAGVAALPFSRVGEATPEGGRAYRAYFTADFVWRMAVAAEVAKGDRPPRNPFFRRDHLRYYWLAHLVPAAQYHHGRGRYRLEGLLLVNAIGVNILFSCFVYAFVRQWTRGAWAAGLTSAGLFLCPSFEGTERLIYLTWRSVPFSLVRTLNIDAVTRWFYESLPVDGLHRVVWYQPQHAVGYALGLGAVLMCAQAARPIRVSVATVAGSILALALLFSTFSAVMTTVMASTILAVLLVRDRGWGWACVAAVCGAVPLALATILARALAYVDDASGSLVQILVNPIAVNNVWLALPLSFGPFLLGAFAGGVVAYRRRATQVWMVGVVIVVSFLFYFFVDVKDHQLVYVGWRAGHLLFLAFGALTACALHEVAGLRRPWRAVGSVAAVFLALAGAPTFAIDLYNTQDISNVMEMAVGRWTLRLDADEVTALEWVRRYTSPRSVVQVDPVARHPATWAYIPAFAERRMSAGIPISMVPLQKYEWASDRVARMFALDEPNGLYLEATALAIDYLYIGTPERTAHPSLDAVLEQRPDCFRRVFKQGAVTIYYVERRP